MNVIHTVVTAARILAAKSDKRKALILENPFVVYHAPALASYVFRWLPLRLERIFTLTGTDKHTLNRHYGHRYAPHYRLFFREFKWKPIKLLEIGIGGYGESLGGCSINAWRWYFPFAKIVACDIEDKSMLSVSGVKIYQVDQSSQDDLGMVVRNEGEFNIIIDDGSHLSAHQIYTFKKLFPSLVDGGVYAIEDIQTSYWPSFGGQSLGQPGTTCMTYFLELTHYLNSCEFQSDANMNDELNELASQISTISFHHNIIFIKKDTQVKFSNI
jgi:demethylmacrocin O-methyltransferase